MRRGGKQDKLVLRGYQLRMPRAEPRRDPVNLGREVEFRHRGQRVAQQGLLWPHHAREAAASSSPSGSHRTSRLSPGLGGLHEQL